MCRSAQSDGSRAAGGGRRSTAKPLYGPASRSASLKFTGSCHMYQLTCGIRILHSVKSTSFCSLLLVHSSCTYHLITVTTFRSHHLTLPQSFTPDLKRISFTNPFRDSLLIPSGRPSRILNLYWTKWHLRFIVLVSCARLSWSHSAFESTLNSSIVSYRILSSSADWWYSTLPLVSLLVYSW